MGTRSHFVTGAVVRIQLDGSDEWVDIRAKLNFGERSDLTDHLMKIGATTATKIKGKRGDTEMVITANYGAYIVAVMQAAIVDWHLLDENDQPIPYNVDLIPTFDQDDLLIDKVLTEVAVRYPLAKRSGPPS